MANPSVTYTFVATTTISASEVNQNFTDIINSLIDGTKSISIDVLEVGGAATITGLLTANGGLTVSGTTTLGGAVTVNDSGADVDFRIESDTLEYNFFLQGSDGFIGINNAAPTSHFHIKALDSTVGINLDTENDGVTSLPMLYFSKNGVFKYGHSVSANEYILADYNDKYRLSLTASLTSFNSSGADIDFSIVSALSSAAFYFQGSDGFIGLGTSEPTTLLHLANGTPYLTLHNTTHEDTDGGRESYIAFRGEQSGGEASTLAKILAQHDGSADDQKGELFFYCNDGDDNDSPIEIMHLSSSTLIINESGVDLDFRIESDTNANAFFVEGSSGNVGIGTSSPDGKFHVHTGSAGTVTPHADDDDLTVENSTNGGISVLTPDANISRINFGSPSLNRGGYLRWSYDSHEMKLANLDTHANSYLAFGTNNGTTRMTIDSSGNVGIGTSSPGTRMEVKSTNDNTVVFSVTDYASNSRIFSVDQNTGGHGAVYVRDGSDTLKMVLNSSGDSYFNGGNVGIGTSSPATNLDIKNSSSSCVLRLNAATNFDPYILWAENDTSKWALQNNNTNDQFEVYDYSDTSVATYVAPGGTDWTATSDGRLKTDIIDIESCLSKVCSIPVRRFKWKKDGKNDFGFIAQELKPLCPEAVTGEEAELFFDENGDARNSMGVTKAALIPYLTKAIQELNAKHEQEVASLKARIEALES